MMKRIAIAALTFSVLLATQRADAALMAYMKVVGTKAGVVKGGVTQKGREDLIGVIAVTHGVSFDPARGTRHGRIVITKELDKSTPILNGMLVAGEVASSVELRFWAPQMRAAVGVGAEFQHYTIRLTNARIADIKFVMPNVRIPDQARLSEYEEVSFTYEKIEWIWNDGGITADDTAKP